MATGWQRQFKASVRFNRAIGMQQSLRKAISDGTVKQDMDIKELAQRFEMSQAQVRRALQEQSGADIEEKQA